MSFLYPARKGLLVSMLFLLCLVPHAGAQILQQFSPDHEQGRWYLYWGWNRDAYSRSDIHFQGTDYDFVLQDVAARDRQTPFGLDPYLSPGSMTIPQYNLRIGYYFSDDWSLSLGVDHMKYVMIQNQQVSMSGSIGSSFPAFAGQYDHADRILSKDFLIYEHTDGLNDLNVEFRHSGILWKWTHLELRHIEGGGPALLIPRTNATLLGMERHDTFHVAGWSLQGMAGIQVALFRVVFVQTELKGGYISLPSVRTTSSKQDHADQQFFFLQNNILFGTSIQF